MTADRYNKIFAWFNARPAAKTALRVCSKGAVALVYGLYIGLFVLVLPYYLAGDWWLLAPWVAVPAACFLLGTALRAGINRPRPYEALGFTPLFPKATHGQSMPSRHCFSAAAIAVTLFWYEPLAAALVGLLALVIAASRVLVGHHYPSDVAAGLAFGAAAAWAGMQLCFALLR